MLCQACGRDNPADASFCSGCGVALAATPAREPTPAPAPALPSSIAGGRYQVQRFVGEGGKKRVYLAHDSRLERDVAIALIKTEGLDMEGLVRVRREAQAMGRLGDHAHIVTVFDIGEEIGQPYLVQEYMAGGSVEDLLDHAEQRRLPIDHALRIGEQVARALEHAHARGIVHRDLKPGNIWLAQDGTAKLGDFGLAVSLDRSRLTREGMMVGTTSYMPPEQALGAEPTPRSDLYALGCVLYEMVTGRPPFQGDDSVAIISQHINTAPIDPMWHNAEVPSALNSLIQRLLAKAPDERPESAAAVADELRRIRERSTEQAPILPAAAPSELLGVTWGRFVGRREEMDQLKTALEGALSGRGSLVMLVGEPGIGKTRLAEEFAVYASLRGAQALSGRCYEGEVGLPYRPFVEAFREYARRRSDQELRHELGEGAPEVAKIVSEIRQRFPDIPEAPALDPEAERLRLFESVSAFVRNATEADPLVLFLDDIHWADKPSLLLLRYLARGTAGQRLLIVGAYRDVELDRTHPLSDVIATLRREQPYQRVLLRGLPKEDVLGFLTALEPSEAVAPGREQLAAALYQETEGNPFFIREILSHLVEEGKLFREGGVWTAGGVNISDLGIPEGVREVIGRRLSRLSEGCNRMLTLASTMTGGFSWEELKAITGEGEAALLDLLDEALAHQLIQERKGDPSTGSGQAPSAGSGRAPSAGSGQAASLYDFTHALIRQTLYAELSTPRRVVLHRQIGQALEALHAGNPEPHLAELAHHFFQAAPGGDIDKAIDYARRAGERAVELLAYEEAAAHYEVALQALDLRDRPDDRQRYDLLVALGQAYTHADVPDKSVPALEQAVQIAERLGDPPLQGQAAIAYADAVGRGPLADTGTAVPVLERALEALGDEGSALKARLLAQTCFSLGLFSPREPRLALARQAMELAERVGDPLALAVALGALYVTLLGPERTEERLAVANARLQAAEQAGDRPHILFARLVRLGDLAELGEMDEVDRELPLLWDLADEMREPIYSGWRPFGNAMRALLEGRFDDAERSIQQYMPFALRTQSPESTRAVNAQFYDLRRAQGRLGELEGVVVQQMEQNPLLRTVMQAALAFLCLETERPDQAREWFEKLAANDFTDVPSDPVWMVTILLCADLAQRLNDTPRAALLYDILLPYAERQVTVPITILSLGSASRPLGQLAATMGRWDDAERHFEYALSFDEKIGARPWLARSRYEYALMLHERGAPGDDEKALPLVNQALATFEELGMPKDLERALALKMALQGVSSTDFKTSIGAVHASVQTEQPDLRPHAAPDGTVTILFTDIEDSVGMTERLGDQRWLELLREHNAIVREQLRLHGGFEVKARGDGFMVAFGSARQSLQCAAAIQRAFVEHNNTAGEPLRIRIGLHTGEAVREANDFYGRHVNLASRIADQARGGEILVSSIVKDVSEGAGDVAFGDARDVQLKGLTGSQRIFALDWQR